ncbi:golgin subfamily A member 6-like protein 6 [Camponotus floridanus]|uniref:golgin subfamily A member 6-like protein 6 n=1 Tax=Camponotus floridanus TaxID=104421 RepID=UPI000DC68317|nr:golgin subfamily A member 6-like protein 6 [Camponotus floridanus]
MNKGKVSKEVQKEIKAIFWNTAGIARKDEEFWEYIQDFDIINFTETWIEEKQWKKMEALMPKEYNWVTQYAARDKKRGRGVGGMITGVKKNIRMEEVQKETQGIISYGVEINGGKWKIISIYNREGKKKSLEELEEIIEGDGWKKMIVGGDFNARTAEKGEIVWDGEEEGSRRYSKDKIMNKQGIDLLEKIEKLGLEIKSFRIGERTESDHQPLEIELKATTEEIREREEVKEKEIEDWTEEGIKVYQENLKKRKAEKEEIQEEWEELVEEIKKAISKKKVKNKMQKVGKKPWWDKDCRNSKTKLNRSLRQMRKGNIKRTEFIEEKQRHNKLCETKKKEEREREQTKIAEIQNETEIWRYIKKERGRREKPEDNIEEQQWKRYFMELLEGGETRGNNDARNVREAGGNQEMPREEETKEEEEGFTEEEMENAIRRLKKKKATGEDRLKNEVWINADRETKEKLRKIMEKIWNGEKLPRGWKVGMIYPIHKKGDKKEVKNYRGVTLLDTAYKIYAMILEEKLRKEVERLKLLPETQAGFRKRRSCIDNIFALKIIAEKTITKKKGKFYVFFADLKAAFDKVNRKKL